MAPPRVSRYPVPALAELPDDIRARMLEVPTWATQTEAGKDECP